METISLLMDGFVTALSPLNLLLVIIGAGVGLLIGAMPGLGSVNGVAILLPVTFIVPPTSAIIFLAAIYYGAMYGGAVSSIMLGIPGASTAVATTFDGRPMAQKGEADQALVAAATGSFVGGTISVILFTAFAPPLASVALMFGSPEEFALMMLAFGTFVGLGGDDIPKTIFSILIGLMFATVGLDVMSGTPRLIFMDLPGFFHGINFLVLAIGIYGIGEILWTIESSKGTVAVSKANVSVSRVFMAFGRLKGATKIMISGSFIGFFVGLLPAAGATPASIMSYGMAKTASKDPKSYGKGNINGVVAPETANNAASTGSMLPMLTLGIPGSPTTAILLGGMVIWGLEPGPRLFVDQAEFVWGLIASLYIANLASLVLNILFIPLFIWILKLPFSVLAPVIFTLCIVGGYAPTQTLHDVWLMVIFGVVGYLMRKLDYPMAPATLAIVLGPLAEMSMRRSLMMSDGSPTIFFTQPIAGVIMVFAILLFLLPVFQKFFGKNKGGSAPAA